MTKTPEYFTKRPVTIQAVKFEGTPAELHSITFWLQDNLYPFLIGDATEPDTLRYPDQSPFDDSRPDKGIYIDPADGALMIRTLEGDMRVRLGDWIIKGVQGEFYPCDPGIFAQTYVKAEPDAPQSA